MPRDEIDGGSIGSVEDLLDSMASQAQVALLEGDEEITFIFEGRPFLEAIAHDFSELADLVREGRR